MDKLGTHRGLVVLTLILISIVISTTISGCIEKYWEKQFGPEAEKFADLYLISQKTEHSNNETFYKIDLELTVHISMYNVEVSPQNITGGKIISFDDGLRGSRTIPAKKTIYPTMTVQLYDNVTYGYVEIETSFIDIDAHEKKIDKNITIVSETAPTPTPSTGGFEFVLVIVGFLAVYILRRRS